MRLNCARRKESRSALAFKCIALRSRLLGVGIVVQPASAAPLEDNPPNNTLFISNLPEDATSAMIEMLFQQLDGFKEVRQVNGRPDIAFVEYVLRACSGFPRDIAAVGCACMRR